MNAIRKITYLHIIYYSLSTEDKKSVLPSISLNLIFSSLTSKYHHKIFFIISKSESRNLFIVYQECVRHYII